MKTQSEKSKTEKPKRKRGNVEIREDLQDAKHGKDLSYLNEMPQMGGCEGVKAGLPSPRKKKDNNHDTHKK